MSETDWNFAWNWTHFCPTGLKPFANDTNDLLPCFQKTLLQLPIYTIFAAISAYNFGNHTQQIIRNGLQMQMLTLRILFSIILAILPVSKIFVFHRAGVDLYAVDILVVGAECIMWVVHCGYLLTARHYGKLSHRGPLLMNVFWLTVVVLDGVWLRTSRHFEWWPWSLATLLCDLCYAATLVPKGNAIYCAAPAGSRDREQEALLSNRYTYFHFELNEALLGHAQDEANWLSRFVFHWVQPLIGKGVAGKLRRIEDLFDLPDALNITRLSERLHLALSQTQSVFRALHKCFGFEFYLIGLLRLVADISSFAGPLLLGGLLRQDGSEADQKAYYYALGLFGSTLLSALCGCHFDWRMAMVSMKMRVGVVNSIYRKALEARGVRESRPDMLNLMSTDADRIVNSCISFHFFWSIPFKLFTTLYLLYLQLGAAFLAGVIFAALLIPINRWLAKRIGIYSTGLMTAKDARLSATTETMQGAKQIKTNAWEPIFITKIRSLRTEELRFLSKRKYLDAMCVYFWATTPVLMCLLTFGVSVLLGNPLIASTTYTSVALLYMLIGPLNAFPWVLNGLIEAWVSLRRVQQLMDVPNLDYSSYYNPIMRTTAIGDTSPSVLKLKGAHFVHDAENSETDSETAISQFRLSDINLDVKAGQLICIEGPVGGGKSSLLTAIIAELQCVNGEVCIQDLSNGFGYVPQSPWLQRATIRDNIVWGSNFDEQWYKTVLHACALNEDIRTLGGDLIGVGENGRTLSGGQRARVALARAVYQDKKIYLLDDVLSSLDAHVAKHIIRHCLLGLLKQKTRIVVTRSTQLFFHANQILHVEDGQLRPSVYMTESIDLSEEEDEEEEDEEANKLLRRSSMALANVTAEEDKRSVDSLLLEESREYGHLSGNVFSCYWKAVSAPLALTVLLFVLLMQLTRNLSDAWLAHWVTETTLDGHTNDTTLQHQLIRPGASGNDSAAAHTTGFYLGIFTAIAVTNSLVTLARAFLFAYAGIKAAIYIHEQLLKRVMFAKFNFFDITSVGRILNRFSSDINTVDDSLPFILNILLAQLAGLVGALCVSLYAMPWLVLVVVPMVPIYLNLQRRYRHASRDIKRLSSNAMSPLYTHFTETLQGLPTIRSMRASARFQRDFQGKLEESTKAQLSSAAAQQWLALRLQMLGALLVGGAGLIAAITASHTINPGLVGLCISYALSITGQLGDLLHAVAETEQELVAVERVDQYLQLEPEQNAEGNADPPFGWPTQGVLSFQDVQLSYREHLSPALRDISFKTEAFERIGIVGRTGAGKSSVLAALLRVAPLSHGDIYLDQMNLKTVALSVLRERIGVITQEPFLFEGTVRENLDPSHRYYDSEIWHAIKSSAAATLLVQQLGGLDGHVDRGGNNLSAGQRQLLCLARALLKNAKVVCIDEGTSSLDDESDLCMQQALRNAFKSCTLIFIAHRLRGLQAMDRILVLDDGRICEQGKPHELAANRSSLFHSMLLAQDISLQDFVKID
ncbi:ATP-binding cassette sub-family C member 10 [Drosophila mojavensis]|uniref:ATP-binding cassette sub-family C member 10 n=1 Tax=Drosophila mojavensis TaxID=7230 RepID=UPI001CD0AE38|nr:ATP-binding cassette sub-family C member 10 [Drosophila mojavensis]XP_043864514.1 ATP-binding cassette sub-family C member 10 [Drosophila mojavensis]XP_043864515.1 ATP-binding cassette sub-family C member 10 [Drosophila mojavensis]